MPRSRKKRHEEKDYYELKKQLKKLVKRRSSRSRDRRHRRRHDTPSSQESRRDTNRSVSPRGGRERHRPARYGRSPHSRRGRSRTRSRSRYSSGDRRSSYTYESPYASEAEGDVIRMSPEVEDVTNKADTGGEAAQKENTAAADKNGKATGSAAGSEGDGAPNQGPSSAVADATGSGPEPGAPADTSAADTVAGEMEIDSTILEIFGEDPTQTKAYGMDIQKDLAVRLEHVAVNGLSKDTRKELKEKYLVPNNCKLIDAPTLNPEIKVAVSDVISKRDKAIEARQKQVACAISCLSQAMTKVISAKEKDTELVKMLMHANQLLCDAQHSDSATRRTFVLSSVKKDMKEQLEKTKPDILLFGQNLSETLKTAKAINKSGAELKVTTAPKSVVKKTGPGPSRALNSRGPPARRPAGPPRTKEPAPPPRNQHSKFSRPSQRRHQTFRR